ncbi:MAG: ECF transporter S component [Clostridia bacterium]|nr:ECF transporter S component [Clostridia bacterium]MDD4571939.1 ECF transporter S component [Clostridia bacterium]
MIRVFNASLRPVLCTGLFFVDSQIKKKEDRTMENTKTLKMTRVAILSALSIVLILLVRIPLFPAAPWLIYDMADVPILIGTLFFGTGAGMTILSIVCLLQAFALGGDGLVGFIMHFCSSGALVIIAGYIYAKRGTFKGLVLGLVIGSLAMTALMVPLNLVFTVHFYGVPQDVVIASLGPVVIPFNLIKAGLNSIIAALVHKGLAPVYAKYMIRRKA